MNSELIYLDYNATTPCDPRVVKGMIPFFSQHFGNAASQNHYFGLVAEEAVETARHQVANLVGAKAGEIIFTSGATESINLVLRGLNRISHKKGKHLITWSTEHKAVLETFTWLSEHGYETTVLPVLNNGLPDPDLLKKSIRKDTVMVAMMLANNETGVMMPIREVVETVKPFDILTFCDATQAIGKVEVDFKSLGVNFAAISAHKFYGPKGTGSLYLAEGSTKTLLEPLLTGGGHESKLRSGTVNVPGIVGMGIAASLAKVELQNDLIRIEALRDHFVATLTENNFATLNGEGATLLPNTANLCFKLPKAELLLKKISSLVAAASGSACTSVIQKPSHVLRSMGLTDRQALSSIRFSLGKFTTKVEVERALEIILSKIKNL